LQTWLQSKNVWQRFCDWFPNMPLLTVSRPTSYMRSVVYRNVVMGRSPLYRMDELTRSCCCSFEGAN
jgi:hypothetical protein